MTLEELRKLVSQMQSNFKIAVAAGSTAVAALGLLGYGKLSDIESKAREKVNDAVVKGSEYFDLIINGQTRVQAAQWETALPYFEKARNLRPDDELTLYSLLMCYANVADIDGGLRLLEETEKSGLFARKFNEVWTLLNAGRLLTLASITKPELETKARYFLSRARRAAELQKGGEMSYVLYAQAIHEYTRKNDTEWRKLLARAIELDPRVKEWPASDRPDPWFELMLRKFPNFYTDFNKALTAQTGD